jgi:hypothetical protein
MWVPLNGGEVDVHVDRGVHMLDAVLLVEDDDGYLMPLTPHFLDFDVPVVPPVLDVHHQPFPR